MKKVFDLMKPYLSIVFGTLLFLCYLNWLSGSDEALAIGIIAVIVAVYYGGAGILLVVMGDRLSTMIKKGLNILSVSLFPTFMFVYFLLNTIRAHDGFGPTGWTIAILSMAGSILLALVYVLSRLSPNKLVARLAYLFAAIFALILLLNVLFDEGTGNTVALGFINVISLTTYVIFCLMLFNSFSGEAPKEEVKAVEVKEEKPQEEKEVE